MKPQSFAALVAREGLPIARATLYNMIPVGEQVAELPSRIAVEWPPGRSADSAT